MIAFSQGDIVKINGFGNKLFVVTSKNAFIASTGVFHVCPMISNLTAGPLHIIVTGIKSYTGTVACEHIKLIDPSARQCNKVDNLQYGDIMNISDAIQGIFEYD